jgi:alkanesulfonate monooxygenase SsuD/methylene tetrahydromethanopterin reductase-like flavin-dependent oxidoreductase (luciferase family)
MRIGLLINQDGIPYQEIRNITLMAERQRFDSFWVLDHFHASPRPDENQMLECWTLLSALAAETKRIRIGALVLNINNRNPALTAKMATTLDQISHGRLEFGIGAGGTIRAERQKNLGYEYEFDAYNIPFPRNPRIRIEKLDEGLEVIKKMWTQKIAVFQGRHYSLHGAICLPKPLQKPYPPIWIGGRGGPKIIRIIAKHADGWNISGISTIEQYSEKLKVLKKACMNTGRSIDDIKTSVTFRGTITEISGRLEDFEKKGLDLAILRPPRGEEDEYIHHFEMKTRTPASY